MEEEIQKIVQVAKKEWTVVRSWVDGITALIGLFASLCGGIAWFVNYHKQKTEFQEKMALAGHRQNKESIRPQCSSRLKCTFETEGEPLFINI